MYFAIAYELWPRLTGRPLASPRLVRLQLWTWFGGMLIVTLPWHLVGVMGQPRRMAYYDLHRSGAGTAGDLGQRIGDRRLRSRLLRAAAGLGAARVASRAECGNSAAQIFSRGQSAAPIAAVLEQFRGLDAAGGRLDRCKLWLSAGAVSASSTTRAFPPIRVKRDDQPDRLTSPDSRFAVWIGATVALFVIAVLIGFVWLPSAQRGAEGLDLWNAICRAVGLPIGAHAASVPVAAQPASTVAWTAATRRLLAQGNAARGAALATTCNNCHGANGISTDAAFPNLAGQSVGCDLQAARGLQERQA